MLTILLPFCALVLAAHGHSESCPERTVKSDFDIGRFVGIWHDVKSPTTPRSSNIKCLHNIAALRDDGGLRLTAMYYNTTAGQYIEHTRDFNRPDGSTAGDFTIESGGGTGSRFRVLDTDYSSYAVLCFCLKRNDLYHDRCWVAAPTKTLGSEAETAASNSLPSGDYSASDQSDCPSHEHDNHHH